MAHVVMGFPPLFHVYLIYLVHPCLTSTFQRRLLLLLRHLCWMYLQGFQWYCEGFLFQPLPHGFSFAGLSAGTARFSFAGLSAGTARFSLAGLGAGTARFSFRWNRTVFFLCGAGSWSRRLWSLIGNFLLYSSNICTAQGRSRKLQL